MSAPGGSTADACQDQMSPKKKQRTSEVKVSSGKVPYKGKLSLLLTQPLDIQFEVFSKLLPQDLLRLSRSSKYLRSVFMSKASVNMWKSCRRNVPAYEGIEFPDIPPDMSEPAYASLVFDHWCMVCKQSARCFDFSCRERVCKICREKKRSRARGLCQFAEVCEITGTSSEVVYMMYSLVPLSPGGQFSIPVAQNIYRNCITRKKQLNSAAFMEYLAERQAIMSAVKESDHNDRLESWHWSRREDIYQGGGEKREKAALAQQTKSQRIDDITSKLRNLGWTPEEFPPAGSIHYKTWKKMTGKAKPLTEEAWPHLEIILVSLLTSERTLRVGKAESGGDV